MNFVEYRAVNKEAWTKTHAYKTLASLQSGIGYFLFPFGMPLTFLEDLRDANCIEN